MPAVKYGTCQVVAQASLAGVQDVRVRAFGRVDGWTVPYISVRIGNVLLNIEGSSRPQRVDRGYSGRGRACRRRVRPCPAARGVALTECRDVDVTRAVTAWRALPLGHLGGLHVQDVGALGPLTALWAPGTLISFHRRRGRLRPMLTAG